jgi:REP element-mobilizing transposase RayT
MILLFSMKQLSLLKINKTHGGELNKRSRKTFRPLNSKRPLHLVLRSHQVLQHGSFLKHRRLMKQLIEKYSAAFNIQIYDYAICTNHMHFVLRFSGRENLKNFLRAFCGQAAQRISGAKGFWENRPFTRILEWGADFRNALKYTLQNELETHGVIHYQKRASRVPLRATNCTSSRIGF